MSKILVTGGAGYIGSITTRALQEEGYDVVVFDNLTNGKSNSIDAELVTGDLTTISDFQKLNDHKFDAIVHFAAAALAGESMHNPSKYFFNNVQGGLNLVDYAKKNFD